MVCNGRTGQCDPVIASDRARRTRLLALGVLDVLGLVEDHPRPLNLAEGLEVALQEGVTGQHYVVAAHSVAKGLTPGALDPMMDHHAKIGGEARRLVPPVGYHRGRANQQDRPRVRRLPFALDMNEGLERLAQSHIVGQAGAQPPAAQEAQPRIASLLIRTQDAGEAGGRRAFPEPPPPVKPPPTAPGPPPSPTPPLPS